MPTNNTAVTLQLIKHDRDTQTVNTTASIIHCNEETAPTVLAASRLIHFHFQPAVVVSQVDCFSAVAHLQLFEYPMDMVLDRVQADM